MEVRALSERLSGRKIKEESNAQRRAKARKEKPGPYFEI